MPSAPIQVIEQKKSSPYKLGWLFLLVSQTIFLTFFLDYFLLSQIQRKLCYLLVALLIALIVYFHLSAARVRSINIIVSLSSNNNHTTKTNQNFADDDFMNAEKNQTFRDIYCCYHKRRSGLNVDLLEDIQLSKRQPKFDSSIFFVITTCLNDSLVAIGKR